MMGCDIHVVLEKKFPEDQKWIGVWSSDEMKDRPMVAQRNYDFFTKVANVRNYERVECEYPKDLPWDVSELAWRQYIKWVSDHHSVSHMDAKKFCEIHHDVEPEKSRKEHIYYDVLGLHFDEGEDYRVVFWFDN